MHVRRKPVSLLGLMGSLVALSAAPARAQNPPEATPPCHLQACALVFDWGSGKTSASYGADRKYGSGDDFEARMRSALTDHLIRTKDAPASGELTITLRPTMRGRTICDAMPGTSSGRSDDPSMSCTAMTDLAVTFATTDPAAKSPSALRISNRCGGGTSYMTNAQFATYGADLIFYALEGQAKKEPKPVSRC